MNSIYAGDHPAQPWEGDYECPECGCEFDANDLSECPACGHEFEVPDCD